MDSITPTKRCTFCGATLALTEFSIRNGRGYPDGRNSICKECDRLRSQAYRANLPPEVLEARREATRVRSAEYRRRELETVRGKQKERKRRMSREAQIKENIRSKLVRAVKRGLVVKPERCEECGAGTPREQLHGHHEDYSKPLEVTWLCTLCHGKTWRTLG